MENQINKIKQRSRIILILAASVILLAALFKINHWLDGSLVDLMQKVGYILAFLGLVYENQQLKKLLPK